MSNNRWNEINHRIEKKENQQSRNERYAAPEDIKSCTKPEQLRESERRRRKEACRDGGEVVPVGDDS